MLAGPWQANLLKPHAAVHLRSLQWMPSSYQQQHAVNAQLLLCALYDEAGEPGAPPLPGSPPLPLYVCGCSLHVCSAVLAHVRAFCVGCR